MQNKFITILATFMLSTFSLYAADSSSNSNDDVTGRLNHACRYGTLAEVEALVNQQNADVSAIDEKSGCSPLIFVALSDIECDRKIQFLLSKKANPDAQDKFWGYTALHLLCQSDNVILA